MGWAATVGVVEEELLLVIVPAVAGNWPRRLGLAQVDRNEL